jgi:vacuolar-type H+-ATPase subunit H
MTTPDPGPLDARQKPGGDLAELVQTEHRLAETLSHARDEAAAIVEAARDAALSAEAEQEQELAAGRDRLQADVVAEGARLAEQVRADGRRAAAALDAIPPARISELASLVIERLVGRAGP